MRKIFLLLLVLLSSKLAFSQNQHLIDSLQYELRSAVKDTVKVELLYKLSREYEKTNHSKSYDYSSKSLELSENIGYKRGMAENNTQLGKLNLNQKKYKKAFTYLEKGLALAKEIQYLEVEASSLNHLVNLEGESKKYKKAYSYFNPCMDANARLLEATRVRVIDWTKVEVSEKLRPQFEAALAARIREDSLHYENEKKILLQDQVIARQQLEFDFNMQLTKAKTEKEKQRLRYENELKRKELDNQFAQKEQQIEAEYQRKRVLAQAAQEKKDALADADKKRVTAVANEKVKQANLRTMATSIGLGVLLIFTLIFFAQRNKIRNGKKESDALLLNILPAEVADELKKTGTANAKYFEMVTVLFTDFKDFTQISAKMSPDELVSELNEFFKAFDDITLKHNIEKIKTIGDSYMCVAGLPQSSPTHAEDAILAGLEIREFVKNHSELRKQAGKEPLEIRIGIHSGPAVAGIVGSRKYAYDIWGDTVNTASRMESSGEPGKVNISGTTHELVKDRFNFISRGKIEAKHKGLIDMFFVEGVIASS